MLTVSLASQSAVYNNAGGALLRRYWHIGDIKDLDLALNFLEQALATVPLDSSDRPNRLSNLGNGLQSRYGRLGRKEDLETAIQLYRQALSLVPYDPSGRSMYFNNLSLSLRSSYLHTGRIEDLEESIHSAQQALTLSPQNSSDHPSRLNNLSICLNTRYEHTGQLEDLEEAISLCQQAVTLAPDNSMYLSNLGIGLKTRYVRTGRLEDLDEAIRICRLAVASTPLNSPSLPGYLNSLGNGLSNRFENTGQLEDIRESISLWHQAIDLTPPESRERAGYLTNLGSGLRDLYKQLGQPTDLEESLRAHRQAIENTSSTSPDLPARLTNLASCLDALYAQAGQMEYLEEFIQVCLQAVVLTPLGSPYLSSRLNNLGIGLRTRFARIGRLEDLEEAIQLHQQAMNNTPKNSTELSAYINNLGNSYYDRYLRTLRQEDLEEALSLWRQAIDLTSMNSPDRPSRLSNLGSGLRQLYLQRGQQEYLEDSLQVNRQAVELTPPDSPERPMRLSNLGNTLQRSRRLEDLDEAVLVYQQALDLTPQDSPEHPSCLNNLGLGLQTRHLYTGQIDDLERARYFYRQCCEEAGHHSQRIMLVSSSTWGNWAFERQSWHEASQAFSYGLTAIQNLYKVQFSRFGKESFIRDSRGLPAKAAYALAKTGDLSGAVEVLESGRARQLGEALERTRRDLELLTDPAIGRQDLLSRYKLARDHYLFLAQKGFNNGALGEEVTSHPQDWVQQLESMQFEIDGVIDEIRKIPGYETFLTSPNVTQIQNEAKIAPLIYLVTTPAGGLALIATDKDIIAVELPLLTEDFLRKQVIGQDGQITYMRAYLAWRADPYDDLKRETWKQTLDQTVYWLWEAIMQPIVEKLKTIFPLGNQAILIPSDWLSLLPLHAAWTPDEACTCGRRYALDEFAFTYAPSALALIRSHQQAQELSGEKLLVVENPDQSLYFSEPAAQAALALFNDKTHFLNEAATFEAIQEAFNKHNILYFFTHGVARFDEPLLSGLTLAGRPLTLGDIFNLKTDNTRIAVLSACETGVASNLDLLDEVVSLPSGMLQAGVPGIVGSLWAVLESSTAILMTIFFEQWHKVGCSAPEALRKSQMILRDAVYDKDARNYFKESLMEDKSMPIGTVDILHKQLLINDFDHPFYWAAFTYTGL
jgi:CHAT domain-containing protein/Flp pilus assembly protein TadD